MFLWIADQNDSQVIPYSESPNPNEMYFIGHHKYMCGGGTAIDVHDC